ncbi:hypothetical protein JL720_17149 [Aureococcus anophagefferens]|nr:hypothetical protein JL720_17149 [Aureococcus anophagefferens]
MIEGFVATRSSGSSCYALPVSGVGFRLTWQDARAQCQASGMDLVTIEGDEENYEIHGWVVGPPPAWSGTSGTGRASTLGKANAWAWANHRVCAWYRDWARRDRGQRHDDTKEPYDIVAEFPEECVAASDAAGGGGLWADEQCEHEHHYVCEAPVERGATAQKPAQAGTRAKGPRRRGRPDRLLLPGHRAFLGVACGCLPFWISPILRGATPSSSDNYNTGRRTATSLDRGCDPEGRHPYLIFGLVAYAVSALNLLLWRPSSRRGASSTVKEAMAAWEAERAARGAAGEARVLACTLCQSDRAAALNVPCNHLFLCLGCAQLFRDESGDICHACRAPSTIVDAVTRDQHSAASLAGPGAKAKWFFPARAAPRAAGGGARGGLGDGGRRRGHIGAADLVTLDTCGHTICVGCSADFVRSALGDVAGQVVAAGLSCPLRPTGCSGVVHLSTVRRLVTLDTTRNAEVLPITEEEFSRVERFIAEASIPETQRFYCTYKDCAKVFAVDRGDAPRRRRAVPAPQDEEERVAEREAAVNRGAASRPTTTRGAADAEPAPFFVTCVYCQRQSCFYCKIPAHRAPRAAEARAIGAAGAQRRV